MSILELDLMDEIRVDEERLNRSFGRKLASLLKAEGVTQTELADAIGTTQGFVSQLCKGEKGLSLVTAIAIARRLDVSLDWLLDPERGPMSKMELRHERNVRDFVRDNGIVWVYSRLAPGKDR